MPSGPPELHEKWSNYYTDYEDERMLLCGDINACRYLKEQGFTLNRDWTWYHPKRPDLESLTEEEWSAIIYLIQEWDYGSLVQ